MADEEDKEEESTRGEKGLMIKAPDVLFASNLQDDVG